MNQRIVHADTSVSEPDVTTESHITVLGASGFIGGHLSRYLYRVGLEHSTPARYDERLYDRHLGHVVYCIGLTADFRSRPFDTVEAHICFLSRLIEHARFSSLTYLSSVRVYGQSTYTREDAELTIDPKSPGDLYNLSKLMGESLCLHCGHPNMKIARLSNIVGARRDRDSFIGQMLHEAEQYHRIELKSSGTASRDYLDVEDAVSLLTSIALSDSHGIFNVASGECIQNQGVAALIADRLNVEFVQSVDQESYGTNQIDIERVQREFDFRPRRFHDYFPEFLSVHVKQKHSRHMPPRNNA